MDAETLKPRLKELLVQNLMLTVATDEIADARPLFGPDSLGLDSVDALQIVVMLEKEFGLKLADPAAAREVLQSVNTLAAAVAAQAARPPAA